MIIIRQKEFNSKAAKALNNKYLKEVAAKNSIPVYEAQGFKTVERDPKRWKAGARFRNIANREYKEAPDLNVNLHINDKLVSDRYIKNFMKKSLRKRDPVEYFHGNRVEGNMTSKLDSGSVGYLKEQLLKSKEAREAAKKA